MSDGQQPLREALTADLAVPTWVTQRMLKAIAAEQAHLGAPTPAPNLGNPSVTQLAHAQRPDESHVRTRPGPGAGRRRSTTAAWVLGAAAAALLLVVVGLGMALPVGPSDEAASQVAAGAAGELAGSGGPLPALDVPPAAGSPLAAKADRAATALTPDTVAAHAQALLAAGADRERPADPALLAACAAISGREDLPTVTEIVDFAGMRARLVVFDELNRIAVWVVGPDCVAADPQVLLRDDFAPNPDK